MTPREALIEILEEEIERGPEPHCDLLLPDRIIIALDRRGFMIVEFHRLVPEIGHA